MTRTTPFRHIGLTAFAALALPAAAAWAQDDMMQVSLRTADGGEAGTASVAQAEHGVLIAYDLKNLSPGSHGFHIHETGACTPDFKAAGGHYNPLGSEHGFESEGGYHVGDLPNIMVTADGTSKGEMFVPQVTLNGPENDRYPYTLHDTDGSALMVHAEGDDYKAMASSGDRVACGVIVPASR